MNDLGTKIVGGGFGGMQTELSDISMGGFNNQTLFG
jgi:hypothetical protein